MLPAVGPRPAWMCEMVTDSRDGFALWGRLADIGGLDNLWPSSGPADSGQVWAMPVTVKDIGPLLTNEHPY